MSARLQKWKASAEVEKLIILELLRLGCCLRCSLRFVLPPSLGDDHLGDTTERLLEIVGFICNVGQESLLEYDLQRRCICCLNLLNYVATAEFEDYLFESISNSGFEFLEYTFAIALPISTLIRQYSLWYYLQDKLGKTGILAKERPNIIISVKEAIRSVLTPKVSRRFNTPYQQKVQLLTMLPH